MNSIYLPNEILVIASYPPRECGIATYSKDLINALSQSVGNSFSVSVCALEKGKVIRNYPSEVKYVLDTTQYKEYIQLAEKINRDKNIRAVFIQHEFGLYGGTYGEILLYLLYSLNKPVVVTFHTVLPQPDEKRKQIVKGIADAVNAVVVMTNSSSRILMDEYNIPESKINIIPHGTHPVKLIDKAKLKEKYKVKSRIILSTFGLISSNKSIETALEALPPVIEKFPDILYLIIGRTHPEVMKHEGEVYRLSLEQKISELGLHNHVRFVNQYLEITELLELLQMTHVYLFTSKDPNQAVSGTFAYAMSCGCPVISTAIPHAKEMLSLDTGVLVDFQNPEQFSVALLRILSDNALRNSMSKNAIDKSSVSEWRNVAAKHALMFQKYLPEFPFVLKLIEVPFKPVYRLAN